MSIQLWRYEYPCLNYCFNKNRPHLLKLDIQQSRPADKVAGMSGTWMEESERWTDSAVNKTWGALDRATPTKMRQLRLCTASTLDLVFKLVDIAHSTHLAAACKCVARLVIRRAQIYIACGKRRAWFLEITTTFAVNCCCWQGCSCLSSICGAGVCVRGTLKNNKTNSAGFIR